MSTVRAVGLDAAAGDLCHRAGGRRRDHLAGQARLQGEWFGIKFVLDGYAGLFQGAFGSPKAIAGTLVRATPLIFAGLAVALAFRCGLFNIGVEGQLALGALVAAGVGFGVTGSPPLYTCR